MRSLTTIPPERAFSGLACHVLRSAGRLQKALGHLNACLKTSRGRRVRARGLQELGQDPSSCSVFKQALILSAALTSASLGPSLRAASGTVIFANSRSSRVIDGQ